MDMPGKSPAGDPARDLDDGVEPRGISPAIAWVLSLAVPGVGQAYCGNTARGAAIAFFFAVSLFGVLFLTPSSEEALQLVWWVSLRVAIVLYAFAPLDAYLTAREMMLGEEWPKYENPRVAAALNLLTMGGGYLYLGEMEKGFASFLLLSVLSRSELTSASLLFEVALMVIAIDAYRLGEARAGEFFDPLAVEPTGLVSLALHEPSSEPRAVSRQASPAAARQVSVLGPAIPLGLVCLLGVFYLRMISLRIEAPSYDVIDQSRARIVGRKGEWVYQNPEYGVEARVPVYWRLSNPTKDPLFAAESVSGKCSVTLILERTLPFVTLESKAETLTRQVLIGNPSIQLLRNRPEKLGNLFGYEVAFATTVQGEEWFQSHVLAVQGETFYRLVTTASGDREGSCWSEGQKIRREIVISR